MYYTHLQQINAQKKKKLSIPTSFGVGSSVVSWVNNCPTCDYAITDFSQNFGSLNIKIDNPI